MGKTYYLNREISDEGNPLFVADTNKLVIDNALDFTNYDLNALAFSEVTNISNDYILDNIELNFSTNESKTITVLSSDGTILWGGDVDTSSQNLGYNTTAKHFNLIFEQGFNGSENITVNVTQLTSAGTMDCILKVRQGSSVLNGNPVLGAGNEIIGKVRLVDANGVEVTDPDYNSVNVSIQDQTTEAVELFLARLINTTTLAINGTLLSNALTLTAGHGAVVGNYIGLKENKSFMQARILTVSTNDITLDMPLDNAFTTLAQVTITSKDMKVDGSSTPVVFRITPTGINNGTYHIKKLRFNIVGTSTLKGEDFASITNGLTKGVMFRIKDGYYKNIGVVKSNNDFNVRADVVYEDKPLYSLRAIKNMSEDFGVVIKLDSSTNDELQIVIQDNLNVLEVAEFNCIAQGHVTKE
jgi:hypothetical protein